MDTNIITNEERKVRVDSKLEALNAEQRAQLVKWLGEENRGYEEVKGLLATEFGVETSVSALGRFYARAVVPVLYAEAEEALTALRAVAKGQPLGEAALRRAEQLALDALMARAPEEKVVQKWFRIVDSATKAELSRRRLALEEWKLRLREKEGRRW